MASTPSFNWPTPDNTGLVKNGALDIRTLGDAIDTSLVDLKGGTTGQVLSKTSNTDMDFTWVAQDDSNAIQNAIVDAKGDIIVATANDTPARLAVGTNGQVLKANSATATGLEWATDASGMTNPMTTTGDTIYSSSGSTPARLGIGSTGQVLTVAGGVPSWATPASSTPTFVGCRVTPTADKSISNATATVLDFGSETFDTDGFHDNSTNNSRITIPSGKGGKYLVQMCAAFQSNGTGTRQSFIYKNGASIIYFEQQAGTGNTSPNNSVVLDLAAADYLQFYVSQNSGGSLNVFASGSWGTDTTSFGVTYLGA